MDLSLGGPPHGHGHRDDPQGKPEHGDEPGGMNQLRFDIPINMLYLFVPIFFLFKTHSIFSFSITQVLFSP